MGPHVPILIANLFPQTRYLTILRNPVTHVWSAGNFFDFDLDGVMKNDSDAREQQVVALFDTVASIAHLNGMCAEINAVHRNFSQTSMSGEARHLLMRTHYKRIVSEY